MGLVEVCVHADPRSRLRRGRAAGHQPHLLLCLRIQCLGSRRSGPGGAGCLLRQAGAEESPWFRGLLPMAPRLAMLALLGCPWAWLPRPCCAGLLALTLPIPGLMLELLPPRRSSDSCLCLEAASGTRFPLFKRLNSPPLGINSSGRSFSKSNNDPKSRNETETEMRN